MDPNNSAEMMEKFWTNWFTTLGAMQNQAASAAGRVMKEAAEIHDNASGAAPFAAPGGAPFAAAPAFMTPEAMRQFQNAFMDSLSKYCDEYMRSPQFLAVMKTAMENALTFREQVNEFVNKTAAAGFQPPSAIPPDETVIVDAVRETERTLRSQLDRLADRIDRFADRLDRIEVRLDGETPR